MIKSGKNTASLRIKSGGNYAINVSWMYLSLLLEQWDHAKAANRVSVLLYWDNAQVLHVQASMLKTNLPLYVFGVQWHSPMINNPASDCWNQKHTERSAYCATFLLRILVSTRSCSRSQIHLEALWEVKWAWLKLTLWVIIFTWSNKGGVAIHSQTPADTFGVTQASINTTNPCRHMYPGSRRWGDNKIGRIHINRSFTSCCLRVWSGANSVSANTPLCGHAHWPTIQTAQTDFISARWNWKAERK